MQPMKPESLRTSWGPTEPEWLHVNWSQQGREYNAPVCSPRTQAAARDIRPPLDPTAARVSAAHGPERLRAGRELMRPTAPKTAAGKSKPTVAGSCAEDGGNNTNAQLALGRPREGGAASAVLPCFDRVPFRGPRDSPTMIGKVLAVPGRHLCFKLA